MQIQRIKETSLYVKDLHATKAFYLDLGLSLITFLEGRHVFFRAGESVLLCFNAEATEHDQTLPPHGAQGVIHIAFEVSIEDYIKWKEKVQALSLPILLEKVWKNNRKSFYFHDPDGHLLEIAENSIW